MRFQVLLALVAWLIGLAVATRMLLRWLTNRQRLQARMFADVLADVFAEGGAAVDGEPGTVAQWLFAAGYRRPHATTTFFGLTALCGLFGLLLVWLLPIGPAIHRLTLVVKTIPGGVGEVFVPVILAAPWLAVVVLAAIPTLVVRAARRRRVRQVEQDLPIVLELLATLAEAGLGFDSAIERVLDSLPRQRVLARELRAFRRDNLAGRPRIDSLRWLGRRVAVSWFSIFISAVVHADQVGAGLADVLKMQADDLRQRRKEQALAAASSAPVKLLAPMIACFIPGLVTVTLGPTIFEVVQTLESLLLRPR